MKNVLVAVLAGGALLAPAVPAAAAPLPEVKPKAETPGLFDDAAGGNANADDPAIWVNRRDPGRSLVLGTAKEGGLEVYGLNGKRVQHLAAPAAPGAGHENGRYNNVDLVGDLAIVTDRGRGTLRFFSVDAKRRKPLKDVTVKRPPLLFDKTQAEVDEQRTPYGLAAWKTRGGTYALVSRRHSTTVALVRVVRTRKGVTSRLVRTLALPKTFALGGGRTWSPCLEPGEDPQVEGMVVDTRKGVLYAAQEDVGIWRIPATLKGRPKLVERVREFGTPAVYDPKTEECAPSGPNPGTGGTRLSADAEGLTIYYGPRGRGYLLASSQGDSTFAVFDLKSGRYLNGFRVGGKDGAQHSDGAAVTAAPLGRSYPHGLLVVHDGENAPAVRDREGTNFKFVPWERVAKPLRLVWKR
ncbi:phytase [Actinocorallia longicatena]|uniref:Phytase n=1 Tax=Actinocorallia longicatena TaxID=111803 RepID=A0ABP6QF10_9ACTN